ncbi:ATP-binding domain-containing protein [Picosynechococcus sp. NKBG15041c]|uniref:Dph6-related ATP pyrophosphatase n=1 Tax=Picosynechococcus sp. NKBG15041c TaxID=1407650 RepID=UPI0004204AD3|nr:ATP-binding domain-containing protein [Picosynechococcus sp. NKBG15041c]
MKKKILMSWSSGKDSAWALYTLQQNPDFEVVGLFCTINKEFDRISMHGVRIELLQKQAESLDLPLEIIEIPYPCRNIEYEKIMGDFVERVKSNGVEYFAFGDLFLEDVRNYREEKLKGSGIQPIFPIWGIPTEKISREMVKNGLKTITICVDSKRIPDKFLGKIFDDNFLDALPETIDPCGENGEFHTFVYDAPMFKKPIEITIGERFARENFVYVDILLATATNG